jgi:hypothetical protein
MQLAILDSSNDSLAVDLIPGPPDSLRGEEFDEEAAAVAAADAAAIAASRREPAELDLDSWAFDDEDQEPLFGDVDEDFAPRDPVGDDEELADLDDLLRSGERIQGEPSD